MNLGSLILLIGTIAIILTLISSLISRQKRNWVLQFLQHFCGTLFVISGFVKAIDPLGTAYKMEQYFGEFATTFADTWMSWISPLFPYLSSHSTGFAITMIVLEIVLGIMLILGIWKKLTAWAFFLLVLFFTVLTGFTFLTGYVPTGKSFFAFDAWGPYTISNMRVTDCGCFGDFIKLEPKVSFFKDVVLLIPAIFFLLASRSMTALLPERAGKRITLGVGVMILAFCLWNSFYDLPVIDFRPFRENVDLRGQKIAEEDAQANVEITAWLLKNKSTGR
ncbi:MAG: DoxX family membrane protein [Saprospiraceae bacterium]|nr:DoxX family membrane protein [Saprospiraceae bacterium]